MNQQSRQLKQWIEAGVAKFQRVLDAIQGSDSSDAEEVRFRLRRACEQATEAADYHCEDLIPDPPEVQS